MSRAPRVHASGGEDVPEGGLGARAQRASLDLFRFEFVSLGAPSDFPWRAREGSLLTPEDHAELLDSMVRLVEAFELVGAVA
jgi:hypothetical protein